MRPATHPATPVGWPGVQRQSPYALSLIVDGGYPFDHETMQAAGMLPTTPHSFLDCSTLPGATPIERGQALLAEIRRRKAAGEFSVTTPALLFLHARQMDGELILGDDEGRLQIPAVVLLHALSAELMTADAAARRLPVAPVVLSGCQSEAAAAELCDFTRPILINGGPSLLLNEDARAVLAACVRLAEWSWLRGETPMVEQWHEHLSAVSGERLHQVGDGDWVVHDLLSSSTSLGSVSAQQAGLWLRSLLMNGSVDEFAEGLQLFGTDALAATADALPPLHLLLGTDAPNQKAKIVLLAALGLPIDQRDTDGNTALHLVCDTVQQEGEAAEAESLTRAKYARVLLTNGANPLMPNAAGKTPRELADASGSAVLSAALSSPLTPAERTTLSANGLRTAAVKFQWRSVISLLDDPQQLMDIDDEGSAESSSDTGHAVSATPVTSQFSERERIAAAGLVSLGDT